MDHWLHEEAYGVRLRPARLEDAPFIVWLRNRRQVQGKIGDSAADVPGQESWLRAYFRRPGDYYFIIETLGGIPVGTHSLYNIRGEEAELGRWIVRSGVQAAVPSQMLIFSLAFERLGLKQLLNATVASNQPAVSLSRRLGFEQIAFQSAGKVIGGQPVDMIHFLLTAQRWASLRARLVPLAHVAELLVRQWNDTQLEEAKMRLRTQRCRRCRFTSSLGYVSLEPNVACAEEFEESACEDCQIRLAAGA